MLGIDRNADLKAIKDAFRTLALQHHPDRDKSPGAEDRFKEIAEAYAVLSDPKKRTEYDARGFAGVAGFSSEDLFGGINFDDIFGGLNVDFGGASPFESFFHRRRTGPARGANIEVELLLTLERIAAGGDETLRLARPSTCPACRGTGEKDGAPPPKCKTCGGAGRLTRSRREQKESVLIQQITTCPACHGRGTIVEHPCPQCHGSGEVEQEESLTVKIPLGAEEGMALRIPGKGMPSPDPNGMAATCTRWCVRSRIHALNGWGQTCCDRKPFLSPMPCSERHCRCPHWTVPRMSLCLPVPSLKRCCACKEKACPCSAKSSTVTCTCASGCAYRSALRARKSSCTNNCGPSPGKNRCYLTHGEIRNDVG